MRYSNQVKLEEYRALLEEHRKNRGYIFGSPIIALGVTAAAMQFYSKGKEGQFILAVAIFIICYSLWFLGNRLRSDARIVSYIQLVHEGEFISKWVGWETLLRQYRIWIYTHEKKGDLEELRSKKIVEEAIPRALLFYPAIWTLYTVLVIAACVLTIIKSFPLTLDETVVGFVTAIVATVLFLYYSLGSLHPKRLNSVYELERATWICILEKGTGMVEK